MESRPSTAVGKANHRAKGVRNGVCRIGKVCGMQKAEPIIQAIYRMGEKRIPLTRVYRSLYSEDLFLQAYAKLYRNSGAMTPGPDDDTVDGMSRQRVQAIIEALRCERYRFRPSRRIRIPKGKGGTRRLGIPNFTDKLVQEVLRSILEAYYEPRFCNSSHGFRPGKGCHSALASIKQRFWGTAWFIEGDIRGCFDNIDHDVLMNILARDIHDGRLLNLIHQSLKAGVLDDWRYHHTYSGTPQGGVLSPLLANIYLHELDQFIEDKLIPLYTRGKIRADNSEYLNLQYRIRWARKCGNHQKARLLEKQKWQTPSKDTHDPGYRRLRYIRYADDFLLGFVGPKTETEAIKGTIRDFLQNSLNLELSPDKTLITHARTQQALFLGYAISIYQADEKHTIVHRIDGIRYKRRSTNGKVRLGVPKGLVCRLAKPYQQNSRIIGDVSLLPYSDVHIIDAFQRRFRGIAEYYKYAIDRGCLGQLQYIMEVALTKTLAEKHKISVKRVYKKYRGTRVIGGHAYKTIQVRVPTSQGESTFFWGAVPLKTIKPGTEPIEDERSFDSRFCYSDLLQRLVANRCELCDKNISCEVHHVRKLADLKHRWRGRKEKPFWVKRMIALRRKTLIVCRECHMAIHAGRPIPTKCTFHSGEPDELKGSSPVRRGG